MSAQKSWHFKQLRWSLQGLATAGSEQRALFPEQSVKADELAFDLDHWVAVVRGAYEADLSAPQLDALAAVEQKLAKMSKDAAEFDLDVWSDDALGRSEEWIEIRHLASKTLDVFGWSLESTLG
jgi:hypothetical protein